MSEGCRYESDVIRAARQDGFTDALRLHLAECDQCVATASVAPWMRNFAKISDREHRLPDPAIVWLKARLFQGNADANRAARPMDMLQMIAYLAVAGGWAALLTWRWKAVEAWMFSLTPSGLVQNAARAESLSMSFFAIVFVLASMTVMVAMHTILAEE
jgi:hypothetical protein